LKETLVFRISFFLVALLAAAGPAQSQNDRIVVPLHDPTRPAELRVSLLSGGITVTGWDGKEVALRMDPGADVMNGEKAEPEEDEDVDERARGLHRIPNLATGLDVEEHDNIVEISSHNHRDVDLAIQVPRRSNLTLSTINDGDIIVHDVSGEVTVENTNGDVRLAGILGPVVVHTTNGDIEVTIGRLDPKKGCSFTSMNGDLDVTLPAIAKADLRIKTDNGEIYTDFDLKLGPQTESNSESSASPSRNHRGSRRSYGYETTMAGSLNGGGSMLQFQTFNGSIFIRKGK
jgi:Toastrack DUF4097